MAVRYRLSACLSHAILRTMQGEYDWEDRAPPMKGKGGVAAYARVKHCAHARGVWMCVGYVVKHAARERERERERQVQDPPVGVSWLNYPTRIRPFGFQTGHPEGRRVLGVSFSFGGVPMVSGARNRWKTTRCCARFLFRSPGKGKGKGKEPKGKGKGEGCPGGMGSGMIGLSGEVSAIQTQGLDPQVVGFNVGG